MRHAYLLAASLLLLASLLLGPAARGQDFAANVVKIAHFRGDGEGVQPRYGFIVGTGGTGGRDVYFVVISSDRQFLARRAELEIVLYRATGRRSGTSEVASARQVTGQDLPSIGPYYLALYRVERNPGATKRAYEQLSPAEQDDFHVFNDIEGAEDALNPYFLKKFDISRPPAALRQDPRREPIRFVFESTGRSALAHAGMPLLNSNGRLVGVVAQNQRVNDPSFEVLGISAIRARLGALGKAQANDPCAYFNLLEHLHRRTECDSVRYIDSLRQVSQRSAEEELARMSQQQRRAVRHDKNHSLAVGLTGGGTLNFMSMNYTGNTLAGDGGYSYGLLVQFGPDVQPARLSLKPRFIESSFAPPTDYQYTGSTAAFALKSYRVQAIEVPILLDIATSRKETQNNFFAFGYAPGWQRLADFTFATGAEQAARREPVPSTPRYTHKVLAEFGSEFRKFRVSVGYSYEFAQFIRRDYAFIVGGETITPLRDLGKGYHSLSLELTYRLWGRWQNGILKK